MQPFVVLSTPRTGSTLLCLLLDSHPEIVCHGEIFNKAFIDLAPSLAGNAHFRTEGLHLRDEKPYATLEMAYAVGRKAGARATGFKMQPGQNDAIFMAVLRDRRIRKIVLARRNLLKCYTSHLIAVETHYWTTFTDRTGSPRTAQVIVNPVAFRGYALNVRHIHHVIRGFVDRERQPALFLDYEDLLGESVQREVLAFLGAEPDVALTASVRPHNPPSIRDRVANYDELVARLAGTEWEEMLDQP